MERELAPYGLVLKAGVWYLCARAGDDFRVYRIDRFTAVDVSETRFVRDEDFDLPRFWADRAAQFARSILRTEVTVRLSEAGVRRLPHVVDRAAAEEALPGRPAGRGRAGARSSCRSSPPRWRSSSCSRSGPRWRCWPPPPCANALPVRPNDCATSTAEVARK